MEEEDRKITAYHESGHALVTSLIPGLDPIHKVTIIPRGPALGSTMRMPEKDRYHMARRYVLGTITVLFAGRAAEEIFCVDVSAGARNDIKEATELARLMVCEWGMSEKMGPVSYSETQEHVFLGREISRTRNHSEHVAEEIDAEVRRIIDEGYGRAKEIVRENRDVCDRIANALLRYEVLDRDDVDRLMKGASVDDLKDKHNGNE
jgi:cell division protease FtsH